MCVYVCDVHVFIQMQLKKISAYCSCNQLSIGKLNANKVKLEIKFNVPVSVYKAKKMKHYLSVSVQAKRN